MTYLNKKGFIFGKEAGFINVSNLSLDGFKWISIRYENTKHGNGIILELK